MAKMVVQIKKNTKFMLDGKSGYDILYVLLFLFFRKKNITKKLLPNATPLFT